MFNSVVSLGFSCYVALDLERMGIRESSYPFDWVISNFKDVVKLIDSRFKDTLLVNNIVQDSNAKNCYHDIATGIDYYHDFFSEKGEIKEQYNNVYSKYQRRISRFQKIGCNPTLYVRLIRNEDDLVWILNNVEYINSVIRTMCTESQVVYIVKKEIDLKQLDLRNMMICSCKDEYHPIESCEQIKKYILSMTKMSIYRKSINQVRYIKKMIKKRIGRGVK